MFGKGNKKQKVDWFKNVSFTTAFKHYVKKEANMTIR